MPYMLLDSWPCRLTRESADNIVRWDVCRCVGGCYLIVAVIRKATLPLVFRTIKVRGSIVPQRPEIGQTKKSHKSGNRSALPMNQQHPRELLSRIIWPFRFPDDPNGIAKIRKKGGREKKLTCEGHRGRSEVVKFRPSNPVFPIWSTDRKECGWIPPRSRTSPGLTRRFCLLGRAASRYLIYATSIRLFPWTHHGWRRENRGTWSEGKCSTTSTS